MRRAALAHLASLGRAALVVLLVGVPAAGESSETTSERALLLGTTTTVRDSGLLEPLRSRFEAQSGLELRVVVAGTGHVLELGRRGDVDALLTHAPEAEARFVAAGHGTTRVPVFRNHFVLVGPTADPARVSRARDAAAALKRIHSARATFLSRGDDSGTHEAELARWRAAGLDPRPDSGAWYRESGSGMGATLNTAAELGAYVLADLGTWLAFKRKDAGLVVLLEGDPALLNVYSAVAVSPARHPHVDRPGAEAFVAWLRSTDAHDVIRSFRIGGQPAFEPMPAAEGQS